MNAFQSDESFVRVFMNLIDEELIHDLVFERLGSDPPPLLYDVIDLCLNY